MQATVEEHVVAEVTKKDIKEHGEEVSILEVPKDKLYLCHIVFFFLGIIHFVPISFFNSANNFWMYKFRYNISEDKDTGLNRTALQKNFASSQMVMDSVPTLFFGFWNIMYGHRYRIRNKLLLTLFIELIIFLFFAAFVKINTDDYQTGFFVIILMCSAVLTATSSINNVSTTQLYPRFPQAYMKSCLIGEGVSGILGDLLNVISVAAFDDIRDATLMYFICGSLMFSLTLLLTFFTSKTDFFRYCVNSLPEDHSPDMPKRKDIVNVLTKIRVTILIFFLLVLSMSATHTSITSLVISEKNKNSSVWADKYFTPVLTFMWTDCCMLVGRFIATHTPLQHLQDRSLMVLSVLRSLTLVPFIWFCNAQPRSHLTVLFPHDYQYAIIIGVFMIVNGFLLNMAMMIIPRKTTQEEAITAYAVFGLVMSVMGMALSPFGMLIVNIL